ncbi:MAG: hypothetical protein J0M19_13080 [Sphingomonadales bacterium]|nr:hypothetical protein [Sphingomonadales bacterium]
MAIPFPRVPAKPGHIRVPAFLPAPVRSRADGWTVERQAAFLAALAQARSVAAAARRVGMSREAAYELRRRPGGAHFGDVWDAVLSGQRPRRKLTPEERFRAASEGMVRPRIWRGEYVGIARKFNNSALLGLVRRLTRAGAR